MCSIVECRHAVLYIKLLKVISPDLVSIEPDRCQMLSLAQPGTEGMPSLDNNVWKYAVRKPDRFESEQSKLTLITEGYPNTTLHTQIIVQSTEKRFIESLKCHKTHLANISIQLSLPATKAIVLLRVASPWPPAALITTWPVPAVERIVSCVLPGLSHHTHLIAHSLHTRWLDTAPLIVSLLQFGGISMENQYLSGEILTDQLLLLLILIWLLPGFLTPPSFHDLIYCLCTYKSDYAKTFSWSLPKISGIHKLACQNKYLKKKLFIFFLTFPRKIFLINIYFRFNIVTIICSNQPYLHYSEILPIRHEPWNTYCYVSHSGHLIQHSRHPTGWTLHPT